MPKVSNVVLFLTTVALCVVGLEVGFRAVKGVPLFASVNWRAQREIVSPSIFDPQIGWIQKPNLSVEGFPLHTIDYGIRKNRPSMTRVPTGGVLVTGDSFAAGAEVTDEETWPAHLEDLIQQPVVNAASGSYGIDQMVLRAEQLLPIVRPQTVILGTERDGIFRVTYSAYVHPKPYFRVVDGALVQHEVTTRGLAPDDRDGSQIKRLLGYSYLVDQMMARHAPHAWEKVWEENVEQTSEDEIEVSCLLLQRLKHDADRNGARLLLVLQYGGDVIGSVDTPPKDASMLAQCAKQLGIRVVDEFDTLRPIAKRDIAEFKRMYVMRPGNQSFGHMSSAGNKLIAGLIAEALKEKPVVPAEEGLAQFGQARRAAQLKAPPDRSRSQIIGDGLNRLVNAESLQDRPPSSITRLVRVTSAPRPEYELTAQGEKSEHYLPLALSPSTTGPYTLTIHARSINGANLRLQIVDNGTNVAIGDFDLSRSRVTVTRLGRVQGQKATITPAAGGWHEISLTGILPEDGAQVIIQLVAASGYASFQPAGEAIRFRNLRVEGGRLSDEKSAKVH